MKPLKHYMCLVIGCFLTGLIVTVLISIFAGVSYSPVAGGLGVMVGYMIPELFKDYFIERKRNAKSRP